MQNAEDTIHNFRYLDPVLINTKLNEEAVRLNNIGEKLKAVLKKESKINFPNIFLDCRGEETIQSERSTNPSLVYVLKINLFKEKVQTEEESTLTTKIKSFFGSSEKKDAKEIFEIPAFFNFIITIKLSPRVGYYMNNNRTQIELEYEDASIIVSSERKVFKEYPKDIKLKRELKKAKVTTRIQESNPLEKILSYALKEITKDLSKEFVIQQEKIKVLNLKMFNENPEIVNPDPERYRAKF